MDDRIGPLLTEVGDILAKDERYPLEGTVLFAEFLPGVIYPTAFRDMGDHLVRVDISHELMDKLVEGWSAQDEEPRWSVLQYEIEGGKFNARFFYPDDFDPAEEMFDRQPRMIAERFGNRRIEYPPFERHDDGYEFDLGDDD